VLRASLSDVRAIRVGADPTGFWRELRLFLVAITFCGAIPHRGLAGQCHIRPEGLAGKSSGHLPPLDFRFVSKECCDVTKCVARVDFQVIMLAHPSVALVVTVSAIWPVFRFRVDRRASHYSALIYSIVTHKWFPTSTRVPVDRKTMWKTWNHFNIAVAYSWRRGRAVRTFKKQFRRALRFFGTYFVVKMFKILLKRVVSNGTGWQNA